MDKRRNILNIFSTHCIQKIIPFAGIIFCSFLTVNAQQIDNPVVNNGLFFLNTPYVANTLEQNNEEKLVINCNEVDCTTFVEYVIAKSLCTDKSDNSSENCFADNVKRIRYRDGKINGYTSRLHYTTDWINDNIKKGIIEDITAKNSEYTITLSVDYMSKHPEKYKHLNNSPENVVKIAAIEKQISGQKVRWLPKEYLPTEGFDWIKDGDIITFMTNIAGLDVSHMGIAIYVDGNLHLLHASSKEKKVIVDPLTLTEQLKRSKHVTGIRVLRLVQ